MKKPRNREDQQGQEELVDSNEFQNNESGQNDESDERGGEGRADSQGREDGATGKGRESGRQGEQNDEDEDQNDDQQGEGADEEEGEYEYADQEDGQSDKFDIKKIAQKVKDYMKGESGSIDQETIVKYASVAIVAIYGIRKGGLIGSLLLSAAVGLVTKYLLEQEGQGQEQSQEAQAQAA